MDVEWTEPARADLARIFEFNLTWSYDWAVQVDDRLIERGSSLALMPQLGRRAGTVMRLSVTDIQYVIDYEVTSDRIRILRLQSTREIR